MHAVSLITLFITLLHLAVAIPAPHAGSEFADGDNYVPVQAYRQRHDLEAQAPGIVQRDINSNSNSLTTHSTAPPLGTGTVRTLPVEVTAATEDTAQMANWRWPHKQSLMVTRTGWWDLTNAAADATATSAVPAQTLNARTSPRDVDAISYAPDSPSTAPSPGTVTVCTTADLGGTCSIANVWHKCSPNFKYNYIYSIAQELGAVCTYYRDGGCIAGNHVPSLRGDSRRGRFVWGDMKDWAGKVMSFRCDATG